LDANFIQNLHHRQSLDIPCLMASLLRQKRKGNYKYDS